ncbi:MAG: protein kinase [Planctomycetaceae bacterium]|jgi:serine/threonine protein kinase|nr:protein kinase [Planctomycetaceae bacterium]
MKILVNEYQLQRQIYNGLGGRLWLAQELTGRRKVLVRFLPDQICNDIESIDRLRNQFNQLRPVIDGLGISNLIFPEYFFEVLGAESFLLSSFIDGESVGVYADKWLRVDGRFPLYLLSKIFEPVALMLDVLHERNFIHRFLTPDSIIINRTDGVKLLDFALTGIIREQVIKREPLLLFSEIAKVRYIAPEILRGQPATQLSDQYSLAMIIYEIISGRVLFDSENSNILLKQIIDLIPPDISNCPVETSKIVRKALSKDPLMRFRTTKQFIGELIQSCESETDQSVYQLQGIQETPTKTITEQSKQHEHPEQSNSKKENKKLRATNLTKVCCEFEPVASFCEVKAEMEKLQNAVKGKKSKVIKRILWERKSQKIFSYCYLAIFAAGIIVTIILRDPIISMIKDLLF